MIDRIEITAIGGEGGKGMVSFRREKYEPRGGPNGGDGGDGGDVILQADRSVRNLKEIGRRREYRADRGGHGGSSDKHGRNGEDLVLNVPVGTQITEILEAGTEEIAGDLTEHGAQAVVARGGIGGWGNALFKSSVHQAPRIAQKGQLGEAVRIRLDLKLLADVGLVGLPNAGKSTLLAQISAANPKIGAYPFTTLEPNLGVVDIGWERFVVADIPGLIEGAHTGLGLGLDFLRHIERTRLMIHMLDGSAEDPWADMQTVNLELVEYGQGIEKRPQIVAINKTDIPEVAERAKILRKAFQKKGVEPSFISAASGEGVAELMAAAGTRLKEMREEEPVVDTEPPLPVLRPREKGVRVTRENGAFRVEGQRTIAFAEMMPTELEEGRAELWRRFTRWGVTNALKRAGAKRGDKILLGRAQVDMQDTE